MAIEPTVPKTNKTAQALKIKDEPHILGYSGIVKRDVLWSYGHFIRCR